MKKARKEKILNDCMTLKTTEIIHPVIKESILRVSKTKVEVDHNYINFEGISLKYSFE
jgi:hypothetical protein